MTVETHARKNTAASGGEALFRPGFCAFRSCSSPILLLSSPCQSVGNERTQPAPLPPLPPSALHCALTRTGRESFPTLFLQEQQDRIAAKTHALTRDSRLNALFSLVYGRMGGGGKRCFLALSPVFPSSLQSCSLSLPSPLFGGSLGKRLRKSPHRSPEKRRRRRDLQYNTALFPGGG